MGGLGGGCVAPFGCCNVEAPTKKCGEVTVLTGMKIDEIISYYLLWQPCLYWYVVEILCLYDMCLWYDMSLLMMWKIISSYLFFWQPCLYSVCDMIWYVYMSMMRKNHIYLFFSQPCLYSVCGQNKQLFQTLCVPPQ